jgi:predicted outer membrane repeat protein
MHIKLGRTAKRTAVIGAVAALGCAAAPAALAQSIVYVPCDTSVLAADISAAVSGETLFLKSACTYRLTEALPDITTDLNIFGATGATLDGGSLGFSILTVDSGAHLAVTNVNFSNGGGMVGIGVPTFGDAINAGQGNGGAIDNEGTVAVRRGTFTDNSSLDGGAIYNDGTMTVTGARFVGNNSPGGNGGAIYNEAVLRVTDSAFIRNSAEYGGGIYNDNASFVLTGSTFTGNDASEYGGGLYLEYTGRVSGDVFNGNSAQFGGGAIDVEDPTTLSVITLRGNRSEYGGGIYVDDVSGIVAVLQSKISGNDATQEGGGVYNYFSTLTMNNTVVAGNDATGGGGGIYNESGTVTLYHSLVTFNTPDNCEPTGTIATCSG